MTDNVKPYNDSDATDDDGHDAKEKDKQTKARFRVDVPGPKANLVMGVPEADFGYTGISMRAEDNLFFDIGKDALTQIKGGSTTLASGTSSTFAKRELLLSSAESTTMASKRVCVIAAGAGYMEDPQLLKGSAPPMATFNASDLDDILHPCSSGLKRYEIGATPNELALGVALGETSRFDHATAVLASEAQTAACRAATLVGTAKVKTETSDFVDTFSNEWAGMKGLFGPLGALGNATKVLDQIDRALQRPDTLPFAGPLFVKIKHLRNGIGAALGLYGACKGFLASKPWDALTANTAKAAEGLAGQGVDKFDPAGVLKPARNFVRAVAGVVGALTGVVAAAMELFGLLPPKPSALGLVASHGVSIVTPDKVFGYAAGGFHFVSAPKGEQALLAGLNATMRDKVKGALGGAASDFLLGAKTPRPAFLPGFVVSTSGTVKLVSQSEVVVRATGAGHARVQAGGIADLSGVTGALVSARSGDVEMTGRRVFVGIPTLADARKATRSAPALQTYADATRAALEELVTAHEELRGLAREALEAEGAELMHPFEAPTLPTARAAWTAEAARLRAAAEAAKGLQDAKQVEVTELARLHGVAQHNETVARRAAVASRGSHLPGAAKALGITQALTRDIQLAATSRVDVYGGAAVEVESAAVTLVAKPQVEAGAQPPATITMAATVTLEVGDFVVEVAAAGVTIKKKAGPEIKVDAGGITFDAKGQSLKMLNLAGMTAQATGEVRVAGATINIG